MQCKSIMQCNSIKLTCRGLLAGVCFAAVLVAGAAGSAYAADYTPVTDARLANPEPANWLMTRGNYKGWSYSALDQINTRNVRNLVPVWSFSTGVDSGHESPPIVNNGVMFVTTPYSQVIALDAATGDLLWRYKRALPEGFSALHNTNRGVALYGDKVYFAALDAMLVALDAKTGKIAWEAKIEDWKQSSKRLTPRPASQCGRPIRFRPPASPAAILGKKLILGRPAAPPHG